MTSLNHSRFRILHSSRHGKLMSLVNAIMLAGAMGANAATPSPSASSSSSSAASTSDDGAQTKKKTDAALDEVVVTAKTKSTYQSEKLSSAKYTEPLRDTPQTVTIVPKQLMQDQNTTSLRQVLQNVPGVTMQAGEGGNLAGDNINIRGFNAHNDLFVDGVRDTGVYNRDPFNLDQVEVIKGPGSTATGHGSTGGSVNMQTKTPEQENFTSGSIGLGTDQYTRETMDLNRMLATPSWASNVSDIAVRLNGVYQYNQFASLDQVYNNHWALAPSASMKIGADTKLIFTYLHQQENNRSSYGVPVVNAYAVAANPSWAPEFGHPAPVPYGAYYGYPNRDHENTTTDIPTFRVEHTVDDDLKLANTTRYERSYRDSAQGSPRFENVANGVTLATTTPLTAGQVAVESKSRHQLDDVMANVTEVTQRFKTWDIDHTFVGTVEVSREREAARTANAPQMVMTTGNAYPYAFNFGDKAITKSDDAAFSLFDTIKFDEHWEASLGMRFDHVQQDSQTLGYMSAANANHFYRTDDLPSWRSALVYKPIKPASFYFGYGTSFNTSIQSNTSGASGQAGLTAGTSLLEPEKDETYEMGTKWDVLKEKLSLTAALFRTNKTNARITDPTTALATSLAGKQHVQGVEVGATGNITEEWSVFGGYTYMQSRIDAANAANINTIGKHLPNTPEQSASFWTTYKLPKGVTIGSGVQFMDKRYDSTANINDVNGYWKQDAMLSYEINKNITAQLNVTNLWDTEYIDRVGGNQDIQGAGRTFVFSTNFKY